MKIFLLLLTLHLLLFGSYEQALAFYEKGEYKKAVTEAKASTSEYANPQLHLLWAKAAQALKQDNEAIAAYERVIILDENNIQAKIALLKLYAQTSREELAQELYEELQSNPLTPKQKKLLSSAYTPETSCVDSRASLGIGYDTNINVSPSSNILNDYYGGTNSAEQATLFAQLNAALSYTNELSGKGAWYAKGALGFYGQNNFDAHYYDLYVPSLSGGIGYNAQNYKAYIPLQYSRVYYLEKDLLQEIALRPKLNLTLSQTVMLYLHASYKQRKYMQSEDSYKDDSSFGGGIGGVYVFSQNYIYLDASYESYSANESRTLSYLDKDILTLYVALNYALTSKLKTNLSYKYRASLYTDKALRSDATLSTSERADRYSKTALKLSYELTKNYKLYVSNRYIQNESNHALAKYTKNITMLGITLHY